VNVWDPEITLDESGARRLLAEQFPDLALESVVHLADGFDNTVFVVDGTWAVRFPRREVAVALLARELPLLEPLAPRLPLPVPVPQLIGRPAGGYPWPFWGARLLPGVELAAAALPDDARESLGGEVGRFLAALHDPAVARDLGEGLPQDPMRRGQPAVRGPLARETLDRLASRGGWETGSAVDRAVDDLLAAGASLPAPVDEPVLVHGDFHLRHLLVTADGAATGVIDWGDTCLADPAVDLSMAFGGFAGPARAALLSAYGGVLDEGRELRARVLAVGLCAALADYADDVGLPSLLAESLAGIARAVG
jgi:aminoglycoside phosphotransferase (APT) family kinase protein